MNLVLDFLLIAGVLFTCFIIVFLYKKKDKEISFRVLIGIFAIILLVFINHYAYLHQLRYLFYGTFIFSDSADVLIGPLLLLYVRVVIKKNNNIFRANAIHFVVPLLYVLVISIPILWMNYYKYKIHYIYLLENYLLFTELYSIGYCLFSLSILIQFQKLVRFNFSNLDNRDLNWFKYLLIGVLVVFFIELSSSFYEVFFDDTGFEIGYITVISIIFLVFYLGYYGIFQSSILLPDFLFEIANSKYSDIESKSTNTTYNYDSLEMEKLSRSLNNIMIAKKPFLDEDLTLNGLAGLLEIPDKKLSVLLNQTMEVSFYDYVNGFRVEEFKDKIVLPEFEKYTLLAIAFESGFKSKSSFNRIFKKLTKSSPSNYRKQLSNR